MEEKLLSCAQGFQNKTSSPLTREAPLPAHQEGRFTIVDIVGIIH